MARWMECDKTGTHFGADGYCSDCGEGSNFIDAVENYGGVNEKWQTIQYPFCPWCGAEMEIDDFSMKFRKVCEHE